MVTTNDLSDGQMLPDLLNQIEDEIDQVLGEGAYNQKQCYDAIRDHKARATIPPRRGAKIWQHGNCKSERHDRSGESSTHPQSWAKSLEQESNYHRRSIAETTMFRFKTIFGSSGHSPLARGTRSRKFDNQAVELFIKCAALNRMIQIAKPYSYQIEA